MRIRSNWNSPLQQEVVFLVVLEKISEWGTRKEIR